MKVGPGFLLVFCGLGLTASCGGGPGEQKDAGPGGSGNDSGSSASLSGGQSGRSESGGSGGSPSDGGATNAGAGGSDGGTGGIGTGGAAGAPAWPDWVSDCVFFRAQLCSLCAYPECVMCVYGTDEEIAETGVVCNDTEEHYRMYCSDCGSVSGCPPFCRDEWY